MTKFRGLFEDKATRQYRVFTTLDSHVKVPVMQARSAVEKVEFFETQFPTGVAHRTWGIAARQLDPELRRAEL